MAKKSVELRQKKASIWKEANELTGKIESSTGKLTPEERSKWDQMNAEMLELDQQIKDIEIVEARSIEFANNAREGSEAEDVKGKTGAEKRTYEERFMEIVKRGMNERDIKQLNAEYRLGKGHNVEYRGTDTQVVGTSNLGGLLVPQTWANSIEKQMTAYGEVLDAVTRFTTTGGGTINFPYYTEASKGKIIAENTATIVDDISWATKSIGAYKYTSDQIVVSSELFEDAAYDVGAEVTAVTAERIGRILAEHVTTGTGSGQPTGILTSATASGDTVAVFGAIDTAAITALEHSVNRAHRNKANARFMFADSILEAIKILDIGSADGRPLWRMSVRDGEPDTINGYQYIVNDEMPTFGANNKIMAFGDFSKYKLRQVGGYRLMRLNELGALSDNTIFLAYARFDGNLIISDAIKTLADKAA